MPKTTKKKAKKRAAASAQTPITKAKRNVAKAKAKRVSAFDELYKMTKGGAPEFATPFGRKGTKWQASPRVVPRGAPKPQAQINKQRKATEQSLANEDKAIAALKKLRSPSRAAPKPRKKKAKKK